MKQKKHHVPIAKEKSKNQYSPVPPAGIDKGDVCTSQKSHNTLEGNKNVLPIKKLHEIE